MCRIPPRRKVRASGDGVVRRAVGGRSVLEHRRRATPTSRETASSGHRSADPERRRNAIHRRRGRVHSRFQLGSGLVSWESRLVVRAPLRPPASIRGVRVRQWHAVVRFRRRGSGPLRPSREEPTGRSQVRGRRGREVDRSPWCRPGSERDRGISRRAGSSHCTTDVTDSVARGRTRGAASGPIQSHREARQLEAVDRSGGWRLAADQSGACDSGRVLPGRSTLGLGAVGPSCRSAGTRVA